MKYIEGSLKPGKPYRQRKMTHSNCAISVEEQVERYVRWAIEQDLDTVHLYPASRGVYNTAARAIVMERLAVPRLTKAIEVDPEDWK